MASMLSAGRTEPAALARNKLSRALSPYAKDDVRYVPTLEETLDRAKHVTLEQIKTLYETQIGGSHAELGVVGDFDPESTLRLVKEMLVRLGIEDAVRADRPQGRRQRDGDEGGHRHARQVERGIPRGALVRALGQRPGLPALRIGNFIFGGSTLASRLGDRIRQKDGLSYGATSSFTASSRDPVASLTVTVSTNPANIDKVTAAVMEELQRFLKDGPTDKEVADAKQAFVESQKVGRTGDAAIAAQIVSNLDTGRTFAFAADQEKAILALTPAKVADAFRKHIDPQRLVVIRAGDFPK